MEEKRKINDRIVLILIIILFSFLFSYGYVYNNQFDKKFKEFNLNQYMCCDGYNYLNNTSYLYCTDVQYNYELNKCENILICHNLILFDDDKCYFEPFNIYNKSLVEKYGK